MRQTPLNFPAGSRYWNLTIIREVEPYLTRCNRYRRWEARCDCGASVIVRGVYINNGVAKSCKACCDARRRAASTTHGMKGTPEFRIWISMRARCRPGRNPLYGGRGISVCERWSKFENFFADMGPRPSATHSIDRIDVNGNYEPGNCRWATPREQQQNTRANHLVTIGEETHCISEWARRVGISHNAFLERVNSGKPPELLLAPPRRPRVNNV